jgi:8-amino-7-oxononanoate synthase
MPDAPAMSAAAAAIASGLAEIDARNLRRTRRVLDSPQGAHVRIGARVVANFSSNDYLGLANDPRLRAAAHAAIDSHGVGAGASPLVSGHMRVHAEAEERFAAFAGFPRALLFGSGYAANLGILAALGGREAEVFSDALNHACIVDGARLARGKVTVYPHADAAALDELLEASAAPRKIVATDAVFSMDGDLAPLARLAERASCTWPRSARRSAATARSSRRRATSWSGCCNAHGPISTRRRFPPTPRRWQARRSICWKRTMA